MVRSPGAPRLLSRLSAATRRSKPSPGPSPAPRVRTTPGPTESTPDRPRPHTEPAEGLQARPAFRDFRTPQRKTTPRGTNRSGTPTPPAAPTEQSAAPQGRKPSGPRAPRLHAFHCRRSQRPRPPARRAGPESHPGAVESGRARLTIARALRSGPAPRSWPHSRRSAALRTARLGPVSAARYEPREAGPPTGQWRGAGCGPGGAANPGRGRTPPPAPAP